MTQKVLMPAKSIPGPAPMPILGSKGNLINFMRDPIGYMIMLRREYGDVAALVREVPRGMVFAFGPRYNQQILSEADTYLNAGITQPGPRESANNRIGVGLLSMNGEAHKRVRRLVSMPFHYKTVPTYHQPVAALVKEMVDGWSDGQVIDIWQELTQLTKRISIKMLLGLSDVNTALSVADLMEEWFSVNISFPARLMPVDLPGFPYQRMLKLAERVEVRLLDLIKQKRESLSENDQDVLSLLLRAGDDESAPFTDAELVGQVNFLFAASYETTANSMSWILFLLSQHPEIMTSVHEHLQEVLDGRIPAYEDLEKLTVLERVMKEGLRLFAPPVYAYRVLSKDIELDRYEMPQGSTIAFSHYMTHHMPEIYEEPERFNPDRWLTIKPTNFEYLPFGAGAHACLGGSLAYLIMKITFSTILSRYRLTVVPNSLIERKVLVTLQPRHGIPMQLTKQDGKFAMSKVPVRGNVHEMVKLG